LVQGKVIALDIDCRMLEQAKAEVAMAGVSVRQWICADAMAIQKHIAEPVDFVLMANTFHGVPDPLGLAQVVRTVLRAQGLFAVINWYPAAREQTPVLGAPRGPKAEMRMSPEEVAAAVEPAGFASAGVIALPPYHYGAIFRAALPEGRRQDERRSGNAYPPQQSLRVPVRFHGRQHPARGAPTKAPEHAICAKGLCAGPRRGHCSLPQAHRYRPPH